MQEIVPYRIVHRNKILQYGVMLRNYLIVCPLWIIIGKPWLCTPRDGRSRKKQAYYRHFRHVEASASLVACKRFLFCTGGRGGNLGKSSSLLASWLAEWATRKPWMDELQKERILLSKTTPRIFFIESLQDSTIHEPDGPGPSSERHNNKRKTQRDVVTAEIQYRSSVIPNQQR
ncbi:hypothetical protein BDD12DRAFT_251344 [Trichophaea hybrida]|nr:hypothetical protein BDD12DRAFT_251344 [Trichophaea hybrida]